MAKLRQNRQARMKKCCIMTSAFLCSILIGSHLYILHRDPHFGGKIQTLNMTRPVQSVNEYFNETTVSPITKQMSETKPVINEEGLITNQTKMKQILMWNHFDKYLYSQFYTAGNEQFKMAGCQVTNCNITIHNDDATLSYEDFDAIWIHALTHAAARTLQKFRAKRKPHQRYIFYLMESPATNSFDLTRLDGFFNWTATYRRDSDIYVPYGSVKEKSNSKGEPIWRQAMFDNNSIPMSMKTKNKSIAWVVSNCNVATSIRDLYVNQLSNFIDIDVYGKCATLKCGEDCFEMIEDEYKFYLAFENSLCNDYITEKFFRSLTLDIVPVVYGGADYKQYAPPHSYIDVNDYSTPRELAKYLRYLEKNPHEYEKYFWWRRYYDVKNGDYGNVLCQFCEKLNDDSLPSKTYDIERWWNRDGICHIPSVWDKIASIWQWA